MGINGSFIGVVFEKTKAFFALNGERNDEYEKANLSGQLKDRTQLRMQTVSHDTFGKLGWGETDCYANKSGVKTPGREKSLFSIIPLPYLPSHMSRHVYLAVSVNRSSF